MFNLVFENKINAKNGSIFSKLSYYNFLCVQTFTISESHFSNTIHFQRGNMISLYKAVSRGLESFVSWGTFLDTNVNSCGARTTVN